MSDRSVSKDLELTIIGGEPHKVTYLRNAAGKPFRRVRPFDFSFTATGRRVSPAVQEQRRQRMLKLARQQRRQRRKTAH